jgi:hypothetical protein
MGMISSTARITSMETFSISTVATLHRWASSFAACTSSKAAVTQVSTRKRAAHDGSGSSAARWYPSERAAMDVIRPS